MTRCKKTLNAIIEDIVFVAKCVSEIKEIEILAHSDNLSPYISDIDLFKSSVDNAVYCLTKAKNHIETAMEI